MRSPELSTVVAGMEGGATPALSLVIATRGRAELLKRCMAALACQQDGSKSLEVIVVDNAGSPDPAVEALCRREEFTGLSPVYVHHPIRGSSGARNKGASLARGRLVGFLDDDAILPPTWARTVLEIAVATQAKIFGGPYFPLYASPQPAWFKDEYACGDYGSQPGWLGERQYLFAANLITDRDLFQELGGFSTALGPGTRYFFGEETDLQHRASRRGVRVWYDPALYVHHHTFPEKMTLGWFIRSSWQKGRVKAIIFREDYASGKTPGLRLRLSWLRQAIGKLTHAALLLLQVPFRSRQSYPYYQNFVIERVCPQISSVALLAGLIRNVGATRH